MISSERASLKRFIKIYQKFIKRLSKSHQNESNIVLISKRLFCLRRNEINKKTNKIFQTMKIKEVNKTILSRSLKTQIRDNNSFSELEKLVTK